VSSSQQLVEPNRSGDTPPTLMIVEVAGKSQESLQQYFNGQGFRTLLTQDPQRALMRFKTWPRPDFLLISAQVLQDWPGPAGRGKSGATFVRSAAVGQY